MSYHLTSLDMRQTRSRRSGVSRNRNMVRTKAAKSGLGPISNTLVLAVILALMGLLYLTQITKQSSYGYQLNDLQQQKTVLLEERSSLEVETARLQALDRIKNSKVAKDLGNPERVEFLRN